LAAAIKQAERRPVAPAPGIVSPKHFSVSAREIFEYETKAMMLNCHRRARWTGRGNSSVPHLHPQVTRATRILSPVLQQDWSDRHRDELSFLGNSVDALRDTDVLTQNLIDAAVRLDDSSRGALESLHDELAERRREQHEKAIALCGRLATRDWWVALSVRHSSTRRLFAAGAVYQVLDRRMVKLSHPVWERVETPQ
jgi:hypothetical protein